MEINIAGQYVLRGDRNSWDLYRLAIITDKAKSDKVGQTREVCLGFHGTLDNALQALVTKHLSLSEKSTDVFGAVTAIQNSLREVRGWIREIAIAVSPSIKANLPEISVAVGAALSPKAPLPSVEVALSPPAPLPLSELEMSLP